MMLYTSVITMSTFLEKPHTAPTRMPTVMLMSAQMNAMEMEILAPFHTAPKVDSPDLPEPKIHSRLKPYFSMAAEGVRCLAEESIRLANWS